MPRGPRLDASGVLHHVMVRGIERRPIFVDDRDRADFVQRLAARAESDGLSVYAWGLLPNHLHLLLRTGRRPLARSMGALLAGYAGAFNRRHHRHGHLFQNRYKSIVVEEDPYLLELTRYIHLNALRTQVVPTLAHLDRYPWSGHSALLGVHLRPWQAVEAILGHFGQQVGRARRAYRQFVADGLTMGRRPDLQGGGLRRSVGGWEGLAALRRGRESWAFDERVLGSGPFVDRLLAELPRPDGTNPTEGWRHFPRILAQIAKVFGVAAHEVAAGSRRRPVAAARAAIGAVTVTELGLPLTRVARALGVTPMPLRRGLGRGRLLLEARGVDIGHLVRQTVRKSY